MTDAAQIEDSFGRGISSHLQHYYDITSEGRRKDLSDTGILDVVNEDRSFALPRQHLRARAPVKKAFSDTNANLKGSAASSSRRGDEQQCDLAYDNYIPERGVP